MKRYLLRYPVFWLPAILVFLLPPQNPAYYLTARWFTLFFMMLGWTVNTGMAAARFPRGALATLMIYFGSSLLLITGWYTGTLTRLFGREWGYLIGGAFSYVPLESLVLALLDYRIPHEVYVTGALTALCAVGWLAGRFYRYLNPNPYHPKFMK